MFDGILENESNNFDIIDFGVSKAVDRRSIDLQVSRANDARSRTILATLDFYVGSQRQWWFTLTTSKKIFVVEVIRPNLIAPVGAKRVDSLDTSIDYGFFYIIDTFDARNASSCFGAVEDGGTHDERNPEQGYSHLLSRLFDGGRYE